MKAEKYLLDTNIITYLYQADSLFHQAVSNHMLKLAHNAEIYVSLLSLYEIEYGIALSTNKRIKDDFISMLKSIQQKFPILPLCKKGSEIFGVLKAGYMKQTGITKEAVKRHDIDFMIAGSAIAENAVLISNDKIFKQLKKIHSDFLLENWAFFEGEY